MRHLHHIALIAATLMLASGCGQPSETSPPGGDTESQASPDATAEVTLDVSVGDDAGPTVDVEAPELTRGQAIRQKYAALFDEVETFLHDPELCVDGHWQLHYGDGQMYGPSFDLKQWRVTSEEEHRDRALEVLEVNRQSVVDATEDLLGAMDDLETIAMSLLSLVECGLYLDDATAYREAADGLIEPLDELAMGLGDYLARFFLLETIIKIHHTFFSGNSHRPFRLVCFKVLVNESINQINNKSSITEKGMCS